MSGRCRRRGSARDYLDAPIDSWLAFYNLGYSALVTPEDGMDITSSTRANVVPQSVVLTWTIDVGGQAPDLEQGDGRRRGWE